MIVTSRVFKLSAFVCAAAAHGAIALVAIPAPPVDVEGASGQAEAAIGSSFADMAAGHLTVLDITEQAVPVAALETVAPEAAPPSPPVPKAPVVKAVDPSELSENSVRPPVMAQRSELSTAKPLQPLQRSAALGVEGVTPTTALPIAHGDAAPPLPESALRITSDYGAVASQTPEMLTAERAEQTATLSPDQPVTLFSQDRETAAVSRSLRPRMRSQEFETAHKPAPRAKSKPKPKPRAKPRTEPKPRTQAAVKPKPKPAARGNGQVTARSGQANGTARATARSGGSGGKSKKTGNAAVSNYPGLVMRKLSRVSRPRIKARGSATVSFRISATGGIAGASISRSSGSAALDKAALQLVRRAAPFPKPPAGAKRSFSIAIKGR
ncbi:MAG: cell envelope integrity protein TolA [Pelagimonas sp.]|uniref:cell envelope integrity protein TolA n=1 Tax=Pelagimonas sp. TaxID=2073170 RepID=UPI003D6BFB5B